MNNVVLYKKIKDLEKITTKNDVFNYNYIEGFALFYPTEESGLPVQIVEEPGGVCITVPITGGKKYYVQKHEPSDRFRIAGFINEPQFPGSVADYSYIRADSSMFYEVSTSPDVNYLVIHLSNTGQKPLVTVSEHEILEVKPRRVIDTNVIKDIEYQNLSESLRDSIYTKKVKKLKWYIGNLDINSGKPFSWSGDKRVKTDFIKVNKGTTFKFLGSEDIAGIYVFLYTDDKEFISASGYHKTFTSEIDGYIRLVSKYSDDRIIADVNVFENVCEIDYSKAPVKRYLHGNFTGVYETSEYTDSRNVQAITTSDIYSEFDVMMTENPDYISKNLLGYGSDSTGLPDENLPIYEYVFSVSPGTSSGANALSDAPNLLIVSSVHGDEKGSVWSMVQFFKQLVTDWKTNKILCELKSNVNFKVIPVLNPGGINDGTRKNRHNVDINRNFSYNWSLNGEGTAPYSEPEAQVFRDWIQNNKDAIVFIDFHNTTGHSYINTPNKDIHNIYSGVIRYLSNIWREKYNLSGNYSYGYVENNLWPVTYNEAYYEGGIELSTILEISRYKPDKSGTMFNNVAIETGVDLLANFILSVLNFFQR